MLGSFMPCQLAQYACIGTLMAQGSHCGQTHPFLPNVWLRHMNRIIELGSFTPQAQDGKGIGMREQLWQLPVFIGLTTFLSDMMFTAKAKPRLPKRIIEAIAHAYISKDLPLPIPEKMTGHSTWSVSTSWAALNGMPLNEICTAAT